MTVKYSLIIPCFNEEKGIPDLLNDCENLVCHRSDVEVILVNNGSRDNTGFLIAEHIGKSSCGTILLETVDINKGYGFGIMQGIRAANGDYVGWCHADLQTPPIRFLDAIKIIENSVTPEHTYVKGKRRKRKPFDKFFSVSMSLFEMLILGKYLPEINAQPNLFHKKHLDYWHLPPNDFSLDLFALYEADRQGLTIHRFWVEFLSRTAGKGSNDGLKAKIKYSLSTIKFSIKLKRR